MRTCRRSRRQGSLLVFGLVVLMVIGLLAALITAHVVRSHRQAQMAERSLQASLLADAALGRAQACLAREPSYAGETWKLAPDDLGGPHGAEVAIRIIPPGEGATGPIVQVRAEFPKDSSLCARSTKTRYLKRGPGPDDGDRP